MAEFVRTGDESLLVAREDRQLANKLLAVLEIEGLRQRLAL
jgi:hypothetical protein